MSAKPVCQDPLWGLDALTLNAVMEMELEDSTAIAGSVKGKQREGAVSDAELALEMYIEEIRACQRVLEDRKMAQSMALAVHRDGRMISEAQKREDQVARDRRLAVTFDSDAMAASSLNSNQAPIPQNNEETDPWFDEEMIEKAAALYNYRPLMANNFFESEDPFGQVQAESSTWAGSRGGDNRQKLGHCVACGETKDFFDVARVPCNHEYCRECLESLFRASLKDESLFPPRCDGKPIQLSQVRFFLPTDLAKDFEARRVELSSKNRIYCHDPHCSTYMPWPNASECIEEDWLACPLCEKTTCTICKAAAHTGDCPNDCALQQLLETAGNEQWQRCFQCHRFVDLEQGCNHMTFVQNLTTVASQALT